MIYERISYVRLNLQAKPIHLFFSLSALNVSCIKSILTQYKYEKLAYNL